MSRAVLLEHETPDGRSHYDWLIERPGEPGWPVGRASRWDGRLARQSELSTSQTPVPLTTGTPVPPPSPDDRILIAFRVAERIDQAGVDRFEAERIGDHRRLYLDYEGEISGGRGRVRRLASGSCELRVENAESLIASIDWGAGPIRYTGRARSAEPLSSIWTFIAEPIGGR